MTNKHTPGPWICDGRTIKSIHRQRRYAVARVGNVLFTEEANDANAALIASAPDLLAERDKLAAINAELVAALDRLIFAAECRDNTMGDQSRLIDVKASLVAATVLARSVSFEAKHARAALAKAKGE